MKGGAFDKYLRYQGIDATVKLASSPNAKMVVIGGGSDGLPLILNMPDTPSFLKEPTMAPGTAPLLNPPPAVPGVPPRKMSAPVGEKPEPKASPAKQ